jgi:hypothetical protein
MWPGKMLPVRYGIIALLQVASFAQTLPDAPSASKKKTADTQFWALTAFNTTALPKTWRVRVPFAGGLAAFHAGDDATVCESGNDGSASGP